MKEIMQSEINAILTLEIEQGQFEYQITTNLTGELISWKNDFLELPFEGQKYHLQADPTKVVEILKEYPNILKYQLPFQVHGFINLTELQGLEDLITSKRELLGIPKRKIVIPAFKWKWLRNIFKHAEEVKDKDEESKYGVVCLLKILRGDKDEKIKGIQGLKYRKIPDADQVIWDVIPQLKGRSLINVYESFESYPSEKNRGKLIKLLGKKEFNTKNLCGILKALKPYDDNEVFHKLIEVYYSTDWESCPWGNSALGVLLVNLKKFNTKKAQQIAWKLLMQPNAYVGEYAAQLLIHQKVGEKKIVKKLLPLFHNKEKAHHLNLIFSTFNKLKNPFFLPKTKVLFDVFIQSQKNKEDLNIVYTMPYLFARRYHKNLPKWIYEACYDESPKVKKAVLKVGISLLNKPEVSFIPVKEMREKVRALLDAKNRGVAEEALKWIFHFAKEDQNHAEIKWLLSKAQVNTDFIIRLELMRTINGLIDRLGYEPAIQDFYISSLKHQNFNIRIAAIHGLNKCPERSFQHLIDKMKKDPDKFVRAAANFTIPEEDKKYSGMIDMINEYGKKIDQRRMEANKWLNRLKLWCIALITP